jgi:hypothetical protein
LPPSPRARRRTPRLNPHDARLPAAKVRSSLPQIFRASLATPFKEGLHRNSGDTEIPGTQYLISGWMRGCGFSPRLAGVSLRARAFFLTRSSSQKNRGSRRLPLCATPRMTTQVSGHPGSMPQTTADT